MLSFLKVRCCFKFWHGSHKNINAALQVTWVILEKKLLDQDSWQTSSLSKIENYYSCHRRKPMNFCLSLYIWKHLTKIFRTWETTMSGLPQVIYFIYVIFWKFGWNFIYFHLKQLYVHILYIFTKIIHKFFFAYILSITAIQLFCLRKICSIYAVSF